MNDWEALPLAHCRLPLAETFINSVASESNEYLSDL